MIAVGFIFVGLAALIHVGIFYMEAFAWHTPRVQRIFGTRQEDVATTRLLALNQGYYNLFLAVLVFLGIVLWLLGHQTIGATLAFAGAGVMFGASMVLLGSKPGKGTLRSVAVQGLPPAIGMVALAIGLGA